MGIRGQTKISKPLYLIIFLFETLETFRHTLLMTYWKCSTSRRIWQLGLEPQKRHGSDRASTFRALGIHPDVFTVLTAYSLTRDLICESFATFAAITTTLIC